LQKRFDSASLRYCDLHGLERDQDWVMLKLQEEIGELTQVWNTKTGRGRDKGLSQSELQQALSAKWQMPLVCCLCSHNSMTSI
jgi:NTP pyrophosphatase (non-canonical NTP hydrolase)